MNNIYLIGFMGSGKSAVAAKLSELHGFTVIEMDSMIEEQEGIPISEIFATKGEAYFRDLETELLKGLDKEKSYVVSCGGGVILREENVKLMKDSGRVVLLKAEPETIYERLKDTTNRPLLNGNMNIPYIRELMEARRPRYDAAKDEEVTVDGRSLDDICEDIMAARQ